MNKDDNDMNLVFPVINLMLKVVPPLGTWFLNKFYKPKIRVFDFMTGILDLKEDPKGLSVIWVPLEISAERWPSKFRIKDYKLFLYFKDSWIQLWLVDKLPGPERESDFIDNKGKSQDLIPLLSYRENNHSLIAGSAFVLPIFALKTEVAMDFDMIRIELQINNKWHKYLIKKEEIESIYQWEKETGVRLPNDMVPPRIRRQ